MRLIQKSCIWQLKATKKKLFLEINYLQTTTTQQVYAKESLDPQARVLCRRLIVTLRFSLLYSVFVLFHYSHSKSLEN